MSDLLPQALDVLEDVSRDQSSLRCPPTSGREYLARVRNEARQYPEVSVAETDFSSFQSKQTYTTQCDGIEAPPSGCPSPDWRRRQIAEFSRLRQKLTSPNIMSTATKGKTTKLPLLTDEDNWCRLCLGTEFNDERRASSQPRRVHRQPKQSAESSSSDGGSNGGYEDSKLPLLSLMQTLSQMQVCKLLEYQVSWLGQHGFSEAQGRWLYALLVYLAKPVLPDTVDQLRRLARFCAHLRANSSQGDVELVPLSLFISLVSHYFDQMDLADTL